MDEGARVRFRPDASVFMLVAANLVVLVLGFIYGMGLRDLVLVYWIQSVVIGIATVLRILNLQRFYTDRLVVQLQPVASDPIASESAPSESGFQFRPRLVVFHTPPLAAPA